MKVVQVIKAINEANKGSYVGITDYISSDANVVSIIGRLGCSYAKMRENAIKSLKEALLNDEFESIIVKGRCHCKDGEYNSRKRSWDMVSYEIPFSKEKVVETAKELLDAWENPVKKLSNNVKLTEKENGLVYNTETNSFNLNLIVEKQTYKENKSKAMKESMGVKEKAKAPETALKEAIKKRFESKMKTYTIADGKFTKLSIGGQLFIGSDVEF